jgi:hypothetical protein
MAVTGLSDTPPTRTFGQLTIAMLLFALIGIMIILPWAILPSRTCSNLQGACHGEQGTARQSREKEAEEGEAQAARSNVLVLARRIWLEERRWQEGLINHPTVWCEARYLPRTPSTWSAIAIRRRPSLMTIPTYPMPTASIAPP